MKSIHKIDIILVGLGMAGAALAWRLIKAGKNIIVIDNENPSSASRVAAGLINPVTGKRLVKAPKTDEYLTAAKLLYSEAGKYFSQQFMYELPMYRVFDSNDMELAWKKRQADTDYSDYIGDCVKSIFGGRDHVGFLQLQTGYLDTVRFLEIIKNYLLQENSYFAGHFEYEKLKISDVITWGDFQSERIIFCEGARVTQNPWFGYLPMQPSLGEILTLKTAKQLPAWIINAGNWILPLDEQIFKLGATYKWPEKGKPIQECTSEQGKNALLISLQELCPEISDYEIINHEAGIRPNTLDKQPMVGFHPEHHELAVFNGFGSRGSLMIPYYSSHFVDVLLNGTEIEPDININRFKFSNDTID